MISYKEAVLISANSALHNFYGGSHSPWSDLYIAPRAIAEIYEKELDDVWEDVEGVYNRAIAAYVENPKVHATKRVELMIQKNQGRSSGKGTGKKLRR